MDSLALLWLGGVVAGLITIFGGLVTLRRLARTSVPIAGDEWEALLAELKAGLRITRNVRLLITNSAAMPATWGVIHPVVLLPADAQFWDDERRRVVLLHELAHVRRNDYLMQIIAQLCCTVYWFHPCVWYTARQLWAERELACDEHVLGEGINACDYAEHLLEIALVFRSPARASIAGVAMARSSQLEGRLHAILSENLAGRWRASRPMRLAAMVALAALTIPLAAMQPWRDAASATKTESGVNQRTSREVVASLSGSPSAPSDTFRWKGVVPAGQWVEVLSLYGDIRAELATGRDVEILAVARGGGRRTVKLGVDRSSRAARFCVIDAWAPESPKPCGTGASGELRNGVADARVDFLINVPAGVGISLHTGRGNVTAESVKSYVWGTSVHGDVRITTTDLAEATVRVGSISAQFGRRSWRQNLEFLTENGDVTVLAPSDAKMMIEVETGLGIVRSEFPGEAKPFGSGQRIFTTVGGGGGMLTLRTGRGMVELKRGGIAVAEVSDIPVSYADAPLAYIDPKPNPNEDPSADPDPNPNPDVEVMTNPDSDEDDPTGERLPVNIPERLLDRFGDAAMRSWPDARVIGRLRDIAATHVKQHAADFVRERSEWALTLVRNGEIVTPLRNALRSTDWRERAYAAWALGETRDPRAADPLTASLGDSHWRVRMHAAAGLQRIGGVRAVAPLIAALADNYWQVRISAVDALAAIGDRRALPSLEAVAERDSRPFVRDEARNAIERIK